MQSVLTTRNRPQAYSAFQSMKKKTDSDCNIVVHRAIEAICDAFGFVMKWLDRFEASTKPTMQIALPIIQKAMRQLDLVPAVEMFGETMECEWSNLQFTRTVMPRSWTIFENATQESPFVVSRLLSESSNPRN